MSAAIDKRLVEMGFNNTQFEKGVGESYASLERFKKSLNFDGSAFSLQGLANATRMISLETLSDSVQALSNRFSLLGVVGMSAINNITTAAMAAGKQVFNALNLDASKMGFKEYETQMGAIQTILANTSTKGTTLEQVNSALDELNTYSDKTIYNFTEMTKNIGTFTAAGVGLEDSTAAIKGIANLAAVSGSNSQQASVAMYQLSQAMASGTVKLMDWNSVVNAGMGGQIFQDSLKETARVHGIAIDDMIKTEGSFRDTLQKGWLTTDILTETLQKFTGDLNESQLRSMGYTEEQIAGIIKLGIMANDSATKVKTFSQLWETLREAAQSGWAKTWQIIIGDFEEAKAFMTEVSNILGAMIGESANARNSMLADWKALGGRTMLIDAIRNAFEAVVKIVTIAKKAFEEVFPPMTGQQLFNLTKGLKELTDRLKISDETASKLSRVFKGVASIVAIVVKGIGFLADGFAKLIGYIFPLNGGLLDILANLGDMAVSLKNSLTTTDGFKQMLANISSGLKNFGSKIKLAFETMLGAFTSSEGFKKAAEEIGNIVESLKSKFGEFATFAKSKFAPLGEFFSAVFVRINQILAPVVPFIINSFNKIKDAIKNFLGKDTKGLGSFGEKMQEFLKPLSEMVTNIGPLFQRLRSKMEELSPVFERIGEIAQKGFEEFGKIIKKVFEKIDLDKVLKLFNTGFLLGILLAIRQFVSSGSGMLNGITGILDGVKNTLAEWQKSLKADILMKIAIAVGILALSLIALSFIDPVKLTTAIGAVTTLFAELMLSMVSFQKISDGKNLAGAASFIGAMLGMAVAILLLSFAMSILSRLDSKALVKGMVTITVLTGALILMSKALANAKTDMISGGIGLILFAVALNILATAVERLSKLDTNQMFAGLVGVMVLAVTISAFVNNTSFDSGAIRMGIGLILLSTSLLILSGVVTILSKLDPAGMFTAIGAITALLGVVAAFSRLTSQVTNLISISIGVAILGGALYILAGAMALYSKLDPGMVAMSLIKMAAALGVIGLVMNLFPADMIAKSVGLLIVSGALLILAGVLATLGALPMENIGKGLLAIAGMILPIALGTSLMEGAIPGALAMLVVAFALSMLVPSLIALSLIPIEKMLVGLLGLAGIFLILGVAGALMTPVVPVLLGLGAAILMLGAAFLAVGVGIALFSVGLASLVATFYMMAPILPTLAKNFAEFLKQMSLAIQDAIPAMVSTVKSLILGLADIIITTAPVLIVTLVSVLMSLVTTLAQNAPAFFQAGFDILMAFLNGLKNNIGNVVTTAVDIVNNFLNALAAKLPELAESGFKFIIAWIDALSLAIENNMASLIAAGYRLFTAIFMGVTNGVTEGGTILVQAVLDLAKGAIDAFKEALGISSPSTVFLDFGRMMIQGLIDGVNGYLGTLQSNITSLVNEVISAFNKKYAQFRDAGANLVMGLIDGIKSKIAAAVAQAFKLATSVMDIIKKVLGIKSPSAVMYGIAEYMVEGFTNGLRNSTGDAIYASKDFGYNVTGAMQKAMSKVSDYLATDFNMNPTIRPVLDMSDLESGAKRLPGLFSINPISTASISGRLPIFPSPVLDNAGGVVQNGSATVSFVQNNYSPKELSRFEIYRQTRNQLASLKGLVTN